MMVQTCCPPDCSDRSATCHATCEKQKSYWKGKEKEYQEKAEQRKINEITDKAVKESYKKSHRKRPQL